MTTFTVSTQQEKDAGIFGYAMREQDCPCQCGEVTKAIYRRFGQGLRIAASMECYDKILQRELARKAVVEDHGESEIEPYREDEELRVGSYSWWRQAEREE